MSSRDACSCLRSLRSRLAEAAPSRRASIIHNQSRRCLTTESQATGDSQATFESIFEPKSKIRTPKDHYYKTSAGVLLCRAPVITRELTPFEEAFYAYQRNLKSRLASPFPTDFYFTKGSLASKRWQAGEEARQRANSLSPSDSTSTPRKGELTGSERELQDEEDIASTVAMSRTTDADAKNDTKSLNRKLDRTLYLLLKKPRPDHAWQLPQGSTGSKEALHESGSRILASLAGKNMNTWSVGRVPVGHMAYKYAEPQMGFEGNKVYFVKSRIFAGQCKLQQETGLEDFGWFTKEEIKEIVSPEYWKGIQAMIATQ